MHKPWKLGFGALLALACAPNPKAPTKIAALIQDNTGAFVAQPVTLSTITDVVSLQGDAANLIGGARVVVDANDQSLAQAQTDQQVEDAILKDSGSKPTASYVASDDVLWPADFHSWNMASLYYNFEQAFDYWQQVPQVPGSELAGAKVYYWASFTQTGDAKPETDNALWYPLVQGFMVLPFQDLQTVPLAMNPGVIAHEYSHRIFNQRVYGGESLPSALIQWGGLTSSPGANLLKSLDEGLADYHAVGATCLSSFGCNPRFFSYSLPEGVTDDRDMSKGDKCMTQGLADALMGYNLNQFVGASLQYQVGTVIASALYFAGENTAKRDVLEKAVVDSYDDSNPSTPGIAQLIANDLNTPSLFTMGAVADAVLAHVTDPGLQTELCNQFLDHLQVPRNDLPHCPAAAVGGNTCPTINPQLP